LRTEIISYFEMVMELDNFIDKLNQWQVCKIKQNRDPDTLLRFLTHYHEYNRLQGLLREQLRLTVPTGGYDCSGFI